MFAGGGIGGGAGGIRTPDLFNAIEALSQLSYSPRVMFFVRALVLCRRKVNPKAHASISVYLILMVKIGFRVVFRSCNLFWCVLMLHAILRLKFRVRCRSC